MEGSVTAAISTVTVAAARDTIMMNLSSPCGDACCCPFMTKEENAATSAGMKCYHESTTLSSRLCAAENSSPTRSSWPCALSTSRCRIWKNEAPAESSVDLSRLYLESRRDALRDALRMDPTNAMIEQKRNEFQLFNPHLTHIRLPACDSVRARPPPAADAGAAHLDPLHPVVVTAMRRSSPGRAGGNSTSGV